MKIDRCYVCYAKNLNNLIELGGIHCAFTTEEEAQDWCRNRNKQKVLCDYNYDYEITTI